MCQVTNVHPAAIFPPWGSPASSAACQPRAPFLVLLENLEAIFPPCPFWKVSRSLVSFLGEACGGLGHPYPFPTRSCAPACGTVPPRHWPAASPEPRAKDGGVVDAQAGMPVGVPLLCLFQFALFKSRLSWSLLRNTCEVLWRVVGSCLQQKKKMQIDRVVIVNIGPSRERRQPITLGLVAR